MANIAKARRLLAEAIEMATRFDKHMESAAKNKRRGNYDHAESERNKANEKAQGIIARVRRVAAVLPTEDVMAPASDTLHQRVWDLLRHQRGELLDEDLISREEYAALLEIGSEAARRLESYDVSRARATALANALNGLRRGACWCELAIGNPMLTDHTSACKAVQALLG